MPQNDLYHYLVQRALQQAGWQTVREHLRVTSGTLYVNIDLVAEKEGDTVAIEIKSFANASHIVEFEKAIGQYITYRTFLKRSRRIMPLTCLSYAISR
jgi:Holliday junction resolvase-like predicted endonuclease